MRAIVIGGTSGVGRSISELLSEKKIPLTIVSSDHDELERLSRHLQITHENEVDFLKSDARSPKEFSLAINHLISQKRINLIFLPMGASSEYDNGCSPHKNDTDIFNINFLSIFYLLNSLPPEIRMMNSLRVVGFGSIASSRGRDKNVMYSSAKGALRIYFQSLRRLIYPHGGIAQFYILGYVKSRQTYGKKLKFPAASPHQVAKKILNNLDNDLGECYYPKYWALIVFVIKVLPWKIFRQMKF